MGLLLSCTHLHGENNSLQTVFYTERLYNIIIGGSTHLNASSLHVNIYLILTLVDCNVKI